MFLVNLVSGLQLTYLSIVRSFIVRFFSNCLFDTINLSFKTFSSYHLISEDYKSRSSLAKFLKFLNDSCFEILVDSRIAFSSLPVVSFLVEAHSSIHFLLIVHQKPKLRMLHFPEGHSFVVSFQPNCRSILLMLPVLCLKFRPIFILHASFVWLFRLLIEAFKPLT
jgi:hypothetical protein